MTLDLNAGKQKLKEKLRQQLGEIDNRSKFIKNNRRAATPRHDKKKLKNLFDLNSEESSETEEDKNDPKPKNLQYEIENQENLGQFMVFGHFDQHKSNQVASPNEKSIYDFPVNSF